MSAALSRKTAPRVLAPRLTPQEQPRRRSLSSPDARSHLMQEPDEPLSPQARQGLVGEVMEEWMPPAEVNAPG